jgi:hypothetical protein
MTETKTMRRRGWAKQTDGSYLRKDGKARVRQVTHGWCYWCVNGSGCCYDTPQEAVEAAERCEIKRVKP